MRAFQRFNPSFALSFQGSCKCKGVAHAYRTQSVRSANQKSHDSKLPSLSDYLRTRIEVRGPLTVADYMRAVLTSPGSGYYMNRDVFGTEGDFITSPEISQIFGEMIGVWCVSELQKISLPSPRQLIELGPGRGTLMRDVIRVFSSLNATEGLSLHMVEISPELSKIQAKKLCPETAVEVIEENISGKRRKSTNKTVSTTLHEAKRRDVGAQRSSVEMSTVTVRRPPGVDKQDGSDAKEFYYMRGTTHEGLPIFWYRSLLDVPRQFSCILAHEFFDALPVHKFKRTKHGWRELLIVPDTEAGKEHFKYVLARSETPASQLLMKNDDPREEAEVSLEAALIMRQLGKRVEDDNSIVLIADYGHEGEQTDTFRAFRQHQQTNPLVSPGSADLTADVDFDYLKKNVQVGVLTFGPITQSEFLHNMGIETRLKALLEQSDQKHHEQLKSGYEMITSPEEMGSRFKFFALFPTLLQSLLEKAPVAGFAKIQTGD